MASLSGYQGNISGTTGATNVLEPKASYRVYVLPRGAHAASSSTGSLITFDSAEAAARFAALQWIQVGTDGGKVRQVTAVGGTSVAINTAVTVAENDRVFLIGATQPSISGSSATYQPLTTIRGRDDDQATPLANSLLTTDANGGFQFWAANGYYDALIQDANVTNVGSLVDINIGMIEAPLIPVNGRSDDIGTAARPWDDFTYSGRLISAVTSSSGATSHRFDTVAGVTQGSLWAFANSGSVTVYGDTSGGIHQSWSLPHVFNVKSARFGGKGDNSTDDTTAVAAAIAAAEASESAATGAIVYFPKGTYIVNSRTIVPSRVRLVGEGARNSILKAGGSFPTSTELVRLGRGGNAFECTVEEMRLDCNSVAGSIAVGSTCMQEGAGLRNVLLTNFEAIGISLTTTGCQNWTLQNIEVYHSNTAAVGLDMASVGQGLVLDATFNANDGSISTAPAIRYTGGPVMFQRIHVEGHLTGISTGVNATGGVINFVGNEDLDDCISISQSGFYAIDVSPNGATVSVNNWVSGESFSHNSGGFYWHSNDGGTFPNKSRFTSTEKAQSVLMSPTRFGTSLTLDGTVGFTGSITHRIASVTAGATVDVTTRNTILFTAGTSQVHTFVGGAAGQRVRFIAAAGATFFRGNTLALSAANVVLGANDVIDFTCLTGGVSWVQSGLVDNGAFA